MIEENFDLTGLNTFHCKATAKYFSIFKSADELHDVLESTIVMRELLPAFILGGGSNILLTKDVNALVLKNDIKGINVVHENEDHVFVKVGAGENWHAFVQHCIRSDWAGLENLSLIPGNVGASPIQNIGAYGVEIKEVFESLSALNLRDKKVYSFSTNDCAFGYRESVFK